MPVHIQIVSATLPPQCCGIGDYTAALTRHLTGSAQVTILTAEGCAAAPVPGAQIEACFSREHPRSVRGICRAVAAHRPDWLLLQYNPFSYERRGMNPYLPLAIRRVRRTCPETQFALMVHEPFVPIRDGKTAVMGLVQRCQLWMLGRAADLLFFTIEPWARRFRPWFPGKPVVHLPVGSNIPCVGGSRGEARARLGIREETLVLGLFGTAHPSRMLDWVRAAALAARSVTDTMVLSIGPHSSVIRERLGEVPVLAEGPLPAEEVSRRFRAMDIYLVPFAEGVCTRRTSLMTGLQHGIPTVGTEGAHTDDVLRRENGRSLLLASADAPDDFTAHVRRLQADPDLRRRLGQQAIHLYEREFAWERVVSRLLTALQDCGLERGSSFRNPRSGTARSVVIGHRAERGHPRWEERP
jgi:glycosyltransferase involved in cell wall biosynthesis